MTGLQKFLYGSLILLAPLLAGATPPAFAFDCTKAATEVEKAICAAPALKQLDDELAAAYAAVKAASSPDAQKMLARSQKRWISEREYCSGDDQGIVPCVTQKTKARLSLLLGTPESGPGTAERLVPVFLVQEGSEKQWDIDISVFRFATPRTAGEKRFNALVDKILHKAKLGPHGEDSNGMTYALEDQLSLTYASPLLISAQDDFYVNEGGAHGNYGTSNINIDLKTGRTITIKDVVDEKGAGVLTSLCKTQIDAEKKKRVPDSIDVPYDEATRDAAIAQTVRDVTSWSIGQDEITVSFDPYAVGAYAEGAYSCALPTKTVKQLAIAGAPLP